MIFILLYSIIYEYYLLTDTLSFLFMKYVIIMGNVGLFYFYEYHSFLMYIIIIFNNNNKMQNKNKNKNKHIKKKAKKSKNNQKFSKNGNKICDII